MSGVGIAVPTQRQYKIISHRCRGTARRAPTGVPHVSENRYNEKPEEIETQRKEAGRLILATNLVDDEKLEPEEIIINYKNQQSCKRGFRFLKDPLFFADSFFVESPEIIETIKDFQPDFV